MAASFIVGKSEYRKKPTICPESKAMLFFCSYFCIIQALFIDIVITLFFQDTLVHGLQSDRHGFAKGFRKNLGGRWRRLVKKKPESDTCAIPPELKDQLKTIYVY